MMKYGRKILFWLMVCCLTSPLVAEKLRFSYVPGTKYRMLGTIYQEVYNDGVLSHTAETLNKISIEITGKDDDGGGLSMSFLVAEKLQGGGLYRQREESFYSRFKRDTRGRYLSGQEYLMPTIRDVPVFPIEEIKPGDSWSAEGEEYHDFRPWGFRNPVSNRMMVNYVYLRDEIHDDERLAVFKIFYLGEGDFSAYLNFNPHVPGQVISYSHRLLFWNTGKGRVERYEDDFNVRFIYFNGQTQQFKGHVEAEVHETPHMDKERLSRELAGKLEEEGLDDVSVAPGEDGVIIRWENINFPPDSDHLGDSEKKKLEKIAAILRNYPGWDIFIAGHTALAGTEQGRQALSEQRARIVGEFLVAAGVVSELQLSYKGYGASKPLADNATPAGMAKNRRVEIQLLEN